MYPLPSQVSDEQLTHRVNRVLRSRGLAPETIQANVCEGAVVLSGVLPNTAAKQACIQCCSHVPGVMRLVDCIHVVIRESAMPPGNDWTAKGKQGNQPAVAPKRFLKTPLVLPETREQQNAPSE